MRSRGARQRFLAAQSPADDATRSRSPRRSAAAASSNAVGFRADVAHLHLSGRLSAKETQQLSASATAAGASGVSDLASAGKHGASPGHMQRDILRKLLKDTDMPEPYFAYVPTHDPKTQANRVPMMIPFLLVHEMLSAMCKNSKSIIHELCDAPPAILHLVNKFAGKSGMDVSSVIPIGFHGDGAPNQKHKSCNVFSWNLLAKPLGERLLFTVIGKEYCCKCGCLGRCTLDAISAIFAWSMRILLTGTWPDKRHDGSPWDGADKSRAKFRGNMGFTALLLQARGDWSWMKELFGMPSWASQQICWSCEADRSSEFKPYWDFGLSAAWRKSRRTAQAFFAHQRSQHIPRSPLFSCPGFQLSMVVIDMLHACDLGVSQVALGNLFWELLPSFGPNRAAQIKHLWERINTYYKYADVSSKIQTLTSKMIKQPSKKPKLRTKGGETRGLIRFAAELAREHFEAAGTDRAHALMRTFAVLYDCYLFVSAIPFDAKAFSDSCRHFLILYASLGNGEDGFWSVKPKFHMFQELGEFQCVELDMSPQDFWAYKDEDFVGWVAKFAGSKGGPSNASTAALRTITKYRVWVKTL